MCDQPLQWNQNPLLEADQEHFHVFCLCTHESSHREIMAPIHSSNSMHRERSYVSRQQNSGLFCAHQMLYPPSGKKSLCDSLTPRKQLTPLSGCQHAQNCGQINHSLAACTHLYATNHLLLLQQSELRCKQHRKTTRKQVLLGAKLLPVVLRPSLSMAVAASRRGLSQLS